MGENQTQINLRVDSDLKQEWEQFVEESGEYGSLSQAIRTAVEKERNGSQPTISGPSGPERTGEILDRLGRLESRIISMAERMQVVEAAVKGDSDTADLATEIFDMLPSFESEKEAIGGLGGGSYVDPETGEPFHGTKGEIFERVDGSFDDVNQAIERLEEDMPSLVKSVEIDGEPHFYKRE